MPFVVSRSNHKAQIITRQGASHTRMTSLWLLKTHPDYRPCAACATARNSARPLFIVSSHSFCGSES